MGRISKRKAFLRETKTYGENATQEIKRYKGAIYARLSSSNAGNDDRRCSDRESLENQIKIAQKFVEEFNRRTRGEIIDIIECYTDFGRTGSNFDRAGFKSLMEDIKLGNVNLVIVKDLSRFGRNYLEVGNYIEKIFPFLGVRFIAVSDGFDSAELCNAESHLSSEIRNLVNDMYAKDFSKKAKVNLKQRREEGSYVGGVPPYGYIAAKRKRRRILIPDEKTAHVVRFIYEKFVETKSYKAVVYELNMRHINPPQAYRKTGNVYSLSDNLGSSCLCVYPGWNKSSVERILKSETYVGNLVQGKTAVTERNEKARIYKPCEEWSIVKDTHIALIDKDLYERSVCVRLKIQRKKVAYKSKS